MRRVLFVAACGFVMSVGLAGRVVAADCLQDSVRSGTVCMDKYEASVWQVPPAASSLIKKIREGKVTLADLTAGGALQFGLSDGDLAAAGCPRTGNGCVNIYAVSIPGVTPSGWVTWFQAAAAARNSFKRLPTNQEWQVAALGTPHTDMSDDGSTTCATDSMDLVETGSRSACFSDVGAFDMVGNLWEWVAEWGDFANGCTSWSGDFGQDISCVGGPGQGRSNLPAGWTRGGGNANLNFPAAGVFAVTVQHDPASPFGFVGFRCVR